MTPPQVRIERTEFAGSAYDEALALRDRVLLSPTGRTPSDFASANPGVEEACAHLVALDGSGVVIGCVLIRPNYPEVGGGKLLQMATHPERQRQGIGRLLVRHAESWSASEGGLSHLFCHAREGAVAFYERLGWRVVGARFEEIGIPHFRMERRLPE